MFEVDGQSRGIGTRTYQSLSESCSSLGKRRDSTLVCPRSRRGLVTDVQPVLFVGVGSYDSCVNDIHLFRAEVRVDLDRDATINTLRRNRL